MIPLIENVICWFLIVYISAKIYTKLTSARCVSNVCLVGMTALVTGGSSGIGFQTVLGLASRGCRVIIADKNISDDIKDNVIRESGNPNIHMEYVDLASFASVRKLADRLKTSEEKLDILINNAGVCRVVNDLTEDGLNSTWQINYFGSFLLTHLLVDLLKKSKSGRIIFSSSALSHFNNFTTEDVKDGKIKKKMRFFDYHNSKFMQIVASDIFAKKLKEFGITSNSWHPGVVDTPIIPQTAVYSRGLLEILHAYHLYLLVFLVGKTPEEGAQTALHLAVSKEVEGVTGKFFGEAAPTLKPRGAWNKELCEGIWTASELLVGLKPKEKL